MLQTSFGALLVLIIIIVSTQFTLPTKNAQAQNVPNPPTTDQNPQPIKTTSRFDTKLSEQKEAIKRQVIYKDDPDLEAGIENVLAEGVDGVKTTIIKTLYYEGQEYSQEIAGVEINLAQDQIIQRGTKIVWKTLDSPTGPVTYWKKMRVYATHYDSHCPGCNDTTATGLKAGKGVIAVDPSVIKLGSKVYIPGYGQAIAGDTGGAIKGNIIDLGFDDARTAGWYAHFIDIYLQ
ncbi:G5 domain-containing protein [Candidatus Daviesbacteria bacterium]|nr:G5 domain-containing protein [Candidatus Daviesbacteria bacterium]